MHCDTVCHWKVAICREAELKRARAEHAELRTKLTQMESRLIVGGENMLEKAEEQARLLEESNRYASDRECLVAKEKIEFFQRAGALSNARVSSS